MEAINKAIKYTLKQKLDASKWAWVDELPQVSWVIQTISRIAIREIPFSIAYGAEVMIPVELGLPSPNPILFNKISDEELRRFESISYKKGGMNLKRDWLSTSER